jgi:hypothetical protein
VILPASWRTSWKNFSGLAPAIRFSLYAGIAAHNQ